MEINITQYGSCDLAKVRGRVDSFTAPKLGEVLGDIIQNNHFNIVLDISEVDYVSSAGLRVMIDMQKTCKQANRGEVVLVGVPKRIYETLELAGFVPLFRLFDNAEDAIGNF